MAEDHSLEERQETDRRSSDDGMGNLEDQYQEHRVLKSDSPVTAEISDVGIADRVYVELSVTESTSLVIALEKSLGDVKTLFDLHHLVGVPFDRDLDSLVGQTVDIRFPGAEMEVVAMGPNGRITEPIETDPGGVDIPKDTIVPEQVITCARRLERYHSRDSGVVPVQIQSAAAEQGTLVVELGLLGEPTTWEIDVPPQNQMAGSQFEAVVESVGQGSVQQVNDGTVYTVWNQQLSVKPAEVPGKIGWIDNWAVTWVLFPSKETASEALAYSPPSPDRQQGTDDRSQMLTAGARENPHDVPWSKVDPFESVISQDEIVQYYGKGGPIEVERGGTTDTVKSFTGYERVVITDKRVILKSSQQATGDEYYKFVFDEIESIELNTGLVNKKISVHTNYGAYRITIGEPDKQACREMVNYVESHIYDL